jgi:N-acetylglucosaminyldiphosphoundecaprenol N-acetyl-beta-D-mannosaminyltransferase
MIPRVDVLGCAIDPLTMDQTVARCADLVEAGGFAQHIAVNAAKLVLLRDDPTLREITTRCELVNADGQSVVWASRLLRTPLPERVAGIDLMLQLIALAEERAWPIYVLGARVDVLEQAIVELRRRHPALIVAGQRDGYFTTEDEAAVVSEIRASGARLLFVAMSTPRKELFLGEHGPDLGVPFVMGVGGAIDVVAGVTRRAPVLWQKAGLEWLYRLLQEPRRMVGRYARTNGRFLLMLARAMVARRRGGRPT